MKDRFTREKQPLSVIIVLSGKGAFRMTGENVYFMLRFYEAETAMRNVIGQIEYDPNSNRLSWET